MSFDVALLDVNVLIALFDNKHQHHSIASMWLINHVKSGGKWASCPITQNGCLRILSAPNYPNHFKLLDIKHRLQHSVNHKNHVFWQDTISLTDDKIVNWKHIQGHKQLTDIYLLALTDYHQGRFITFDNRMQTNILVSKQNRLVCLI